MHFVYFDINGFLLPVFEQEEYVVCRPHWWRCIAVPGDMSTEHDFTQGITEFHIFKKKFWAANQIISTMAGVKPIGYSIPVPRRRSYILGEL